SRLKRGLIACQNSYLTSASSYWRWDPSFPGPLQAWILIAHPPCAEQQGRPCASTSAWSYPTTCEHSTLPWRQKPSAAWCAHPTTARLNARILPPRGYLQR